MTVYVDDMRAPYGRMIMCHMIADSDVELHAMAAKIGVARRWHQAPPRHASHYDIALSKRAAAIAAGAGERGAGCVGRRWGDRDRHAGNVGEGLAGVVARGLAG
jgi:Protein of unknown function (DUF4031)